MSGVDRNARAATRRQAMVLRKTRLKAVEYDFSPVRGAEALSLTSRLTIESWALSGRSIPAYGRAETPYRFVSSRIT
jgi:hypothetical protein